jgi:dihydroflavonol-4-reductase
MLFNRRAARCADEGGENLEKIGVTGAFGFLGSNFIAAMLDAGASASAGAGPEAGGSDYEITAFASRTLSNPLFDRSRVRVESLDVLDAEDLARKFEGLDAVAHFAGRVDFRPRAKRALWDADVLGTARVFDAALAAGVSRLLHVSSICALGSAPCGSLLDETASPYADPLWPGSFASPAQALAAVGASIEGDYGFLRRVRVAYFDAKLAGWELAKVYAREKGLPLVTIFPGTAVGPGDLHQAVAALVDNVWRGRLRLSFGGASAFVDARDLARGALLALQRGRSGEGYIIAGRDEDNLAYADFQDLIGELARSEGWPAKRGPRVLPRGLLLALSRAAQVAAPGSTFSEAFVLAGSQRNVCSSAKARAELGYSPSASLRTAILDCRRFGEAERAAARPYQATR